MLKVRILFFGNIYKELKLKKLKTWKSKLFRVEDIKCYPLNIEPDLEDWGYSDRRLSTVHSELKDGKNSNREGITLVVLDVPLEENYISRIISGNRILLTYYEVKEILQREYIPLENLLLLSMYEYATLYLAKKGVELTPQEEGSIAHHGHEGCINDFCGLKYEIAYSCATPIICGKCEKELERLGVKKHIVEIAKKEMKRIKRDNYYCIMLFLKDHPYISMIVTLLASLFISLLANAIS
jgi:hypothetical protein